MSNEKAVKIRPVIPPPEERNPTALYCTDEPITVQALKEECDINQIIARASKGQAITHVQERVAKWGDFSNIPDYREACDLIIRAEGMFMSMPPDVRERFHNDPAEMIDFLNDPKNDAEAVELGLALPKKVEEVPPKVEPPVSAKADTVPPPADKAGK